MGYLLDVKDLERYREYLLEEEKSPATAEKYIRDIGKLYQYTGNGQELDKTVMLCFKKQLMDSYAPASVNSMLAAVNGFLSFLGYEQYRVKQVRILYHG